MQVNRGKIHKHIGMTLYYTTVGQVKINILEYINETFDTFDKVDPTGGGTKSSVEPAIFLSSKNTAKT